MSDLEIALLCSDALFIRNMLDTEIALAKVQGEQGIIPKEAAEEITLVLKKMTIEPEALAEGTLQNGIPTIPMLAIAKKELSDASKNYLHWGATSQDIVDTATVLMFRQVIAVFEKRLASILVNLKKLAQKHKKTKTIARTRTQQAVPIFFSQKIENWYRPLERHLKRLEELKPRLYVVQLGGAGGNLSALGTQGVETARRLAAELNLNYSGTWHSERDNIAEFSAWLALLAGSFGKMGQDILLLTQTEIGEVVENTQGGGKSSTMPHKNNPILSEAIVALGHFVGNLASSQFQAMMHTHERDAKAWILEWQSIPKMLTACGTILNHALSISANIGVNKEAMQTNLEKLNGLVFSEKACFFLAQYMPRDEAKKAVGQACAIVMRENIHLKKVLEQMFPHLEITTNSLWD